MIWSFFITISYSSSTSTASLSSHLSLCHEIFPTKKVNKPPVTIKELFNPEYKAKKAEAEAKSKYKLARILAAMCAIDFQAFRIVDRPGQRE